MKDKTMAKPTPPTDGFLAVALTWSAQIRRVLANTAVAAGSVCVFIADNQNDILRLIPHPPKWVGGALIVAGFTARAWQSYADAHNLRPANYSGVPDGNQPSQ